MEIPAAPRAGDGAAASRPSAAASTAAAAAGRGSRLRLQYDPEWLAIVRAFHPLVRIGERGAATPPDEGEERYRALIEEHRAWVDEHVVAAGRLDVPDNFAVTAPAHRPGVDPELTDEQPREWTNPQTAAFCDMLGLVNYWDATEEERKLRMENGPAPAEYGGAGRGPGGGRGGYGRGGRGRGGDGGRGRRGGWGGGGGGGGRGWSGGRGRGRG
ncbi:hypothetical protein VTG60DRAFT_657 [Thermothelomyces hinnuleus]